MTSLCLALCALFGPNDGGELSPLLLVVNKADDTVSFVDTGTLKTIGTAATGHHPHEIAVAPDGRTAFVANYGAGDSVSEIDIATRRERGKIRLGAYRDPHGIAAGGGGRSVFVTCEADRAVVELTPDDQGRWVVARSVATGRELTHMLALAPDGGSVYAADLGGSVAVIDAKSFRLVRQVPTAAGCEGIDVEPGGAHVWAANKSADTLSVIETKTGRVAATIPCAKRPIRVKLTPDGARALVSCARSDEVAVFDVASRREVRRIKTAAAPIGLVIDPTGRRAYVANTDADCVGVIDLVGDRVVGSIITGHEPDGLALVPAR